MGQAFIIAKSLCGYLGVDWQTEYCAYILPSVLLFPPFPFIILYSLFILYLSPVAPSFSFPSSLKKKIVFPSNGVLPSDRFLHEFTQFWRLNPGLCACQGSVLS